MNLPADIEPSLHPCRKRHLGERMLWYWVLGAMYLAYRNVAVPMLRDWNGSGSDSQYIPVLFVWLCVPEGLLQRSLKVGFVNMGLSFLCFILAYVAAGIFALDNDMAFLAGFSGVGACMGMVSAWHTQSLLAILLGLLFGQLAVWLSSVLGFTGYGLLSMGVVWPENIFEVLLLSTFLPLSQGGAVLLAAKWNSKTIARAG